MLDKAIDVILQFIDDIIPCTVIYHYDRAVRLRLGKFKETLEPGFYFKIPFADKILTIMVKTKTMNLTPQTVTTKDGHSVVVQAVIKFEVSDVEKILLEVNDPVDACADMVQGIIRDTLIELNWDECNTIALPHTICKKARVEARRWGLSISDVTLTTLGVMQTIRLMNNEKIQF